MATTSVSARFQELFPETNLISLLTRCGGDAGDIFETLQDQYDAHEQEPLVGLLGIKAANIDAFARAEKLQRELTSAVDDVLQTSEAKASVLTQTLTQDAAREQQARENNISTGKAALVNRVLALNATLKFDALAKLSVEELKDLAEAGAPAMPIGMDAARTAAEEYAGTTAVDSVTAEVDPELDESPAHYEVELQTAWGEFEYLVDAYTGKVLSGQKDLLAAVSASNEMAKPTDQKPVPPEAAQSIGYAKAKSIALNHAGVSESKAYDMDIELDDEDGMLVYEVEFKSGGMEYSYEINAASGAILKHETEIDD